jgi:hypothetical protein
MNAIATQTMRNMARHFIVWGTLAVIIMLAGISENQNGTPASGWDRPAAKGTIAYEAARCTPANDDPIKYALIQRLNSGVERVHSDRLIGKALDDALAGKDWKNVRIHGFCK